MKQSSAGLEMSFDCLVVIVMTGLDEGQVPEPVAFIKAKLAALGGWIYG